MDHVADDWVLVNKVDGNRLKLMLSRTGTHVYVYNSVTTTQPPTSIIG
jgi:hypothetical protein